MARPTKETGKTMQSTAKAMSISHSKVPTTEIMLTENRRVSEFIYGTVARYTSDSGSRDSSTAMDFGRGSKAIITRAGLDSEKPMARASITGSMETNTSACSRTV